jgi:O-antigen/teichoic acid export membrane protein
MREVGVGRMFRGSALMVLMRWVMRLSGLVSTMILARILTPSDFGVVTMAAIFVGFLELFTSTNFDLALIRIPEPARSHYDTAWTLQLVLGLLVGAAIFALAPIGSWYFEDPSVVWVARVLSINAILNGAGNIRVVDFRRELDFRKEFLFNVTWKLGSTIVTIGAALILRNYWALVVGSVAGSLCALALGYIVLPYRPRLDIRHTREIVSFSQWMLMFHVGTYLRNRIDTLVVGRLAPAGVVGIYNVTAEMSSAPATEVVIPSSRALFPSLARLADEPLKLKETLSAALGLCFLIVVAASSGMAVVASEAVRVVLGPQWVEAVPLVTPLAFAGGMNAISHVIGTLLAAIGRQRFTAALIWMNVVILIPVMALGARYRGVSGIAEARALVALVILLAALTFVARSQLLTLRELLGLLWRPIVASSAMVLLIRTLPLDGREAQEVSLALKVAVGALAFFGATLALWRASGRPAGAERHIRNFLRRGNGEQRFWA